MKKTAFEILQEQFNIPKAITVDDADGTRLGVNGIYISDFMEAMELYANQFRPKGSEVVLTKQKLVRFLYDAAYSIRMRNPNYSNFENKQQFDHYVSRNPELKKLLAIKK